MIDSMPPKETLPGDVMEPEDLQTILNKIDDHLSFWNVLYSDPPGSQDDALSISLAQVRAVSDWLKMSSAPLYPSEGAGFMRALAYRFLNLPVKIFGTSQIRFNRKLRDFLNELMLTFQEFNKQILTMGSTIDQNAIRIRALEAENDDHLHKIESLTMQLAEMRADLKHILDEHDGEKRA